MNQAVYSFLLRTYGRRPGIWFGAICELVRSLLLRVWVAVIMAQIAGDLAGRDIASAKRSAFEFLMVYTAGTIIGAAGELVALKNEHRQYNRLSVKYAHKLTSKDMAFYRDHQTGYLVSLFKQHLDSTLSLIRLLRADMIRTVISLTVPPIVLFFANWKLGLIAFGIVLVQAGYVTWSSAKGNHYRALSHEAYRRVTGEVADEITNITAFKSSGVDVAAHQRVADLAQQETDAYWLRRKMMTMLDLPRDIITAIGVTIAFLVVMSGASGSSRSVSLVVLTISYMFQIIRNVGDLPGFMMQHDDLITKAHPTLSYLTEDYETIKDPKRASSFPNGPGEIRISHVDFSYPAHSGDKDRRVAVFQDFSLTIAGGEQIGVVGLSGAGKSTLASLLMRFDEVDAGAITIDGTNIRNVRQTDLHRAVAYVPQEPLLFHRSIRENIAYFNDQATDAEIVRAATAAHAHEFIAKLPDGYESMVGERGVKLSGGQKQRVVIARAILKNAPIMIFDEATSALDTESEKIIQRALPSIIGTHTAVVIAHRLSTVAGLDRIIVLHEGKITEDGTHEELLAKKGRYFALWQKQIAGRDFK